MHRSLNFLDLLHPTSIQNFILCSHFNIGYLDVPFVAIVTGWPPILLGRPAANVTEGKSNIVNSYKSIISIIANFNFYRLRRPFAISHVVPWWNRFRLEVRCFVAIFLEMNGLSTEPAGFRFQVAQLYESLSFSGNLSNVRKGLALRLRGFEDGFDSKEE